MAQISFRLADLAQFLNGELRGDGDITITGAAHIEDASDGHITFADGPSLQPLCDVSRASALIVPPDVEVRDKPFIVTEDPRLAFSKVLEMFAPDIRPPAGVHPTAVLGENVVLGEGVSIGAHAYVGDSTIVGDDTVIHPLAYIGLEATLGVACEIHPQVFIGARVQLGNRVMIHAGAAVGADGFGFLQTEEGHRKIPQIGTVIVEDDVEIGANCTVDRATVGATRIGAGTKIDDHVHIAHNCVIGRNCLLCGQVGIAGSTRIGDNVVWRIEEIEDYRRFVTPFVEAAVARELVQHVRGRRDRVGPDEDRRLQPLLRRVLRHQPFGDGGLGGRHGASRL